MLAKTGGRCALCGSTRNVEAHHLDPIHQGGDPTDASRGVALCAKCHRKVEARMKNRCGGRRDLRPDYWNDEPKPYVWHKSADESLASYCQRINDSGH